MRRATERLKSQAKAVQRRVTERKQEEEVIFCGVGQLGGAGAGAFIDTKGANGGPHKLFAKADGTGGVPTNIVVGALIAAPALVWKKMPMKGPAAATGLSLVSVGLYRYFVDKHATNAAANP
jgi:hypothetical protein